MTDVKEPAAVGLRQYAGVWRLPGARTLLVASVLGRLPIGMVPLALVLLVARSTGSYATAGVASALYAVANAVMSPVLGRVADRFRPTPVLLVTGLLYPVAAVGVLLATGLDAAAALIWIASAVLGACMPPLVATARSVWAELTAPPNERHQAPALALETTAFELVFALGPLVVGVLAAITDSAAALVVGALLVAGGTTATALGKATRQSRPRGGQAVRGLGPLRYPGVPMLVLVAAALPTAFGVIGVTVPAYTDRFDHSDALAGLLLGVWGVGSVAGGIWFGSRRFAASLPSQWAVTQFFAATGMLALALIGNPAVMVAALLVGGLALAPALTVENSLVARIAPTGMVNEAYTWVVAAAVGGSALGAAAAGFLVERPHGITVAFVLAGVCCLAGGVAAWLPRTPLRRAASSTTAYR